MSGSNKSSRDEKWIQNTTLWSKKLLTNHILTPLTIRRSWRHIIHTHPIQTAGENTNAARDSKQMVEQVDGQAIDVSRSRTMNLMNLVKLFYYLFYYSFH